MLKILLLAATAALAAESPVSPVRDPALEELNSAVGVWDTDAVCHFTPDGSEFRSKSTRTVKWSENRQFLIADELVLMPGGWLPKIAITSWDPIKKEYRVVSVLPYGSYVHTMTIKGNVATVTGKMENNGQIMQMWASITQNSPSETQFRCECSINNGPKWIFSQGTSRKRRTP